MSKKRIRENPSIKDLVDKIAKVIFESQMNADPEVLKDAILAYMCHDIPLPCSQKSKQDVNHVFKSKKLLSFSESNVNLKRKILDTDIDTLNMELDYINNRIDFNNEIGRKSRHTMGKFYDKQKVPLDFDAQMEREKLVYYQQRYLDSDGYEDVVIVKKNLDADFNFPNDADIEAFEDDYVRIVKDDNICLNQNYLLPLLTYTKWNHEQEVRNMFSKRRALLVAYGFMHNIVQNMIRMISESKPKLVLYSGHDKTLQALLLALGLKKFKYSSVSYASRLIFELYRKKDLKDDFMFHERRATAQDFYFRVVYNGVDLTNYLSFCGAKYNVVMDVVDPMDDTRVFKTYLCPIENIVRFIHDDYFSIFNVTNFKDACASSRRPRKN